MSLGLAKVVFNVYKKVRKFQQTAWLALTAGGLDPDCGPRHKGKAAKQENGDEKFGQF